VSWSRTLKIRQILRAQLEAGDPIALLFSDLRGFTAYTAARGDQAAFRLSRLHEETLRSKIDEGGIVVKSFGDGVMAAFAEAAVAIRAAIAIQRGFHESDRTAPQEPTEVGIGIAGGSPVMTDVDFIGHAVNVAQRLSSIAKGGQILVNDAIRETVTLPPDLKFLPLGEKDLKGVGREAVAEVVWLQEVARVSDGLDRLTLILTEAGALHIEVAKDPKQGLRDALSEMRRARRDEDGPLRAALQRVGARIGEMGLRAPAWSSAAAREVELSRVTLAYRRGSLIVRLPDGEFSLRGVAPADAKRFLERAGALAGSRDSGDRNE
jgi:class 3 adenylate cyclase